MRSTVAVLTRLTCCLLVCLPVCVLQGRGSLVEPTSVAEAFCGVGGVGGVEDDGDGGQGSRHGACQVRPRGGGVDRVDGVGGGDVLWTVPYYVVGVAIAHLAKGGGCGMHCQAIRDVVWQGGGRVKMLRSKCTRGIGR